MSNLHPVDVRSPARTLKARIMAWRERSSFPNHVRNGDEIWDAVDFLTTIRAKAVENRKPSFGHGSVQNKPRNLSTGSESVSSDSGSDNVKSGHCISKDLRAPIGQGTDQQRKNVSTLLGQEALRLEDLRSEYKKRFGQRLVLNTILSRWLRTIDGVDVDQKNRTVSLRPSKSPQKIQQQKNKISVLADGEPCSSGSETNSDLWPKPQEQLVLDIIMAHPNLDMNALIRKFTQRYGEPPSYIGKFKNWLQSIQGVKVDSESRIRVETRDPQSESDVSKKIAASEETLIKKKSFKLNRFKTLFATNTSAAAIEYFWENFDPVRWSIWHCEYKNSENLVRMSDSMNQIYATANRLGMFWRQAFASMCLFREDSHFTISGVWLLKSQEPLCDKSEWKTQCGSYKWTKLNPEEEKIRILVNEYFSFKGDFNGKILLNGVRFV